MAEGFSDRILNELKSMRARLDQIENEVRLTGNHQATANQPLDPYPQAVEVNYANLNSQELPSSDAYTENQPTQVRSRFGTGSFLGIIGILCFVLAASFFIQMAIDSGWLTPVRQILLAGMFGITLIFCGYLLRNKDVSYISLLPGSGIVILFLTSYASGFIYHLLNQPQTLVLMTSVSVFSLLMYFVFRQVHYVLIAAIGAYICPLLMDKAVLTLTDFMGIFLIWDLTFAYMAILIKRREVILVSSYLALLIFFQQAFLGQNQDSLALVAVFQLAQFMIFFGALVRQSMKMKTPLNASETISFFPLLIIFFELEYIVLNRISENLAPVVSLIFAGVVLGIYLVAKRSMKREEFSSEWMVYGFCSIVFLQCVYWENHTSMHSPWFAVVVLAALPCLLQKMQIMRKNIIMVLVVFLILSWEYIKLLSRHSSPSSDGFLEYMLLNLIVCGMAAMFYLKSSTKNDRSNADWFIILILAYVQAMSGLAKVAKLFFDGSSSGAKFTVSILWVLFAVGILMIGKVKKDAFFARTSLFVFAVAIGKVFFHDISGTSSIVKILSLLGIGAILYVGGYLYRHIESWEK